MKSVVLLTVAVFFAANAIAGENRANVRHWAKTTEKRSAVMAGGFISVPQTGAKQQAEDKKAEEKTDEKKETK